MYVGGILSGDYLTAEPGICIPHLYTAPSQGNTSTGLYLHLREYWLDTVKCIILKQTKYIWKFQNMVWHH